MDTRKHDLEEIEKGLKSRDPLDRRQAEIARERVTAESGKVREMRGELLKAHIEGNRGKIDELHHRIEREVGDVKRNIDKYYAGRR